MRRREFIKLVGGAAVVWPLVARAQQPERMRLIGVLTGSAETEYQDRFTAFQQELRRLGWNDGQNMQTDYRWGVAGDADHRRRAAVVLVSASLDVILAMGSPNVVMLQKAPRTVPIVFVASS